MDKNIINVYLLKQDCGYEFIILGIYTKKEIAEKIRCDKIKILFDDKRSQGYTYTTEEIGEWYEIIEVETDKELEYELGYAE
jgi:hypothetical protein